MVAFIKQHDRFLPGVRKRRPLRGHLFDQKLMALKPDNGDTLWSADLGGWVSSTPTVVRGSVFVGSHDGRFIRTGFPNDVF